MDNLDLDINNYNLDELLKLFKLDYHFTVEHLKLAKRRSLQMHPDKSKLDIKYFLFFRKAYEAVEKVFYFRSRRKAPTDFQDYEVDVDENNARLLHSLNGKSVNDFNSWFNKMFEKVKVGDNESDFGYEEWNRKKEVKENRKEPLSEFGQEFEKKKRECKSLVVHNEIKEMSNNEGGYSLSRERPTEYSSDIFSKLGYEDLKKAHTETVVPVTREDFENKKQFSSVNQFVQHRDNQDTTPLSLQQSREYLQQRGNNDNKVSMQRAFSLIKRDIEVEKSNQQWWSNLRKLEN